MHWLTTRYARQENILNVFAVKICTCKVFFVPLQCIHRENTWEWHTDVVRKCFTEQKVYRLLKRPTKAESVSPGQHPGYTAGAANANRGQKHFFGGWYCWLCLLLIPALCHLPVTFHDSALFEYCSFPSFLALRWYSSATWRSRTPIALWDVQALRNQKNVYINKVGAKILLTFAARNRKLLKKCRL